MHLGSQLLNLIESLVQLVLNLFLLSHDPSERNPLLGLPLVGAFLLEDLLDTDV
jgi:hypothetical protein